MPDSTSALDGLMLLGNMTWRQLSHRVSDNYVIVPVGAVEPHGPHLPLASDTIISEYFAAQLAHDVGGFIAPSIGYGVATPPLRLGGTFPGVVSVSGATFTGLVGDVLTSLVGNGAKKLIIVNSAIDNVSFLCEAVQSLAGAVAGTRIMIVNWWDVVGEQFRDALAAETGVAREDDHHAAMVESSLVMYIAPAATQTDCLISAGQTADRPRKVRYHIYPLSADTTTKTGIVYTAEMASAEIGKRVAAQVTRELEAAVRLEFNDPRRP